MGFIKGLFKENEEVQASDEYYDIKSSEIVEEGGEGENEGGEDERLRKAQ